MRWLILMFLVPFALALASSAQQPPPPQTARQALLEMFMSKEPTALAKHLPQGARKVLMHEGDTPVTSMVRHLSSIQQELAREGNEVQTFDEGPILLVAEKKDADEKCEVIVERDDLSSDEDEIELSVHPYHEGQPVNLPVVPHAIFTMKMEDNLWRIEELTVALHVPLNDADYLDGLRKIEDEAIQSTIVSGIRTVNTAEVSYAASYPQRGFTCSLAQLGGMDGSQKPSAERAMLIEPTLASGSWQGYAFAINGCDGPPAEKYQVTAVPREANSGLRSFCSDQSAVVRYAEDGTAAGCLRSGVPLQ